MSTSTLLTSAKWTFMNFVGSVDEIRNKNCNGLSINGEVLMLNLLCTKFAGRSLWTKGRSNPGQML